MHINVHRFLSQLTFLLLLLLLLLVVLLEKSNKEEKNTILLYERVIEGVGGNVFVEGTSWIGVGGSR